jgi:CO/xanthine dehydrogenase FAD-binding subunit
VKPGLFEYAAPATVEDALALLDDESRPLAGGQSLVPLLNFRLARPARLVDLNAVAGHDHVREEDGRLRIGLLARQVQLLDLERWPLLAEAANHVGHPATRNRGTVCGSCAHGDPSAELPAALTALDARFHVRSPRGTRTLAAHELFLGYLTTALEPDELLVEIEVPPHPSEWRFVEYARTHGDWAVVGAARAGDRVAVFGQGLRVGATVEDLDGWQRAIVERGIA